MKRHFPVLIFVFAILLPSQIFPQQVKDSVSLESFSPFHKGTYALSGSVAYSTTSNSEADQTITNYTMSPTFLYFTSKKFALGGQVIFSSNKFKDKYGDSQTSVLGVGPQFRFYFFNREPLIFITTGVFMTTTTAKSGNSNYDGPTHSLAAISLGIDIFTDSHFSLEPFIEYRMRVLENSGNTNTMIFGISFVSFNL